MDFEEQLESLREERERLEEEIGDLEAELSRKASNTESLREDLEELTESIETGRVPEEESGEGSTVRGIERVELDPESGRPPRGARSRQIRQAIDVISRDQDEFKAAELFELLQEADPSIEESQRAYLYSKLKELRDEGVLEKVGRGTWTLDE